MSVVGIVPAAGYATRMDSLPFSKELYPVTLRVKKDSRSPRSVTVSEFLLEKMWLGGAEKAYVVIRENKFDIPRFFGAGSRIGLPLAYIVLHETPGEPFSVDAGYPFVKDDTVIFGYPDILFRPQKVFHQLINRLDKFNEDAVIGLFDLFPNQLTDRIKVADDGKVTDFKVRSTSPDNLPGWAIAAWKPEFTSFLHNNLTSLRKRHELDPSSPELYLGHILQAALKTGLQIGSLHFKGNFFWDIGTPSGLKKALKDREQWQT